MLSEKTKDYLIQALLIVGSVLLALWLNQLASAHSDNKKKQQSFENIINEVKANKNELSRVWGYHEKVGTRLKEYLNSTDLTKLNKSGLEILGQFLSNGLQNAELQNTAWKMAVETEAISFYSYETAFDLSKLYKLQEEGVAATTKKIMEYLTNPALFDVNQNKEISMALQYGFTELFKQERHLADKCEEFLIKYKDKKKI